jgi:hypothetical protein
MKWRQSENRQWRNGISAESGSGAYGGGISSVTMAAWRGYGVNISNNVAAAAAWQWRKTKMAAIVKRKYRNENNGGMVAATWRNQAAENMQ